MPTGSTGQQPSLFATRPLPEQSPAAQYARSTEQPQQQMPVAPMPVPRPATPPPRPPLGQASQTAAYGQPAYAVKPSRARARPRPSRRPARPRPCPTVQAGCRQMTAPMPAVPGQTSNWQAALPVAPWSAYERQSGPVTGLETETVLRSDLKSLKRSRTRAWLLFAGVLVVAGTVDPLRAPHDGEERHQPARAAASRYEAPQGPARRRRHRRRRRPRAALRQGSRPPRSPAPSMAPPAAAGPPTASAKALAEELKRQLMGDAAISVEARGERVIVSIDEASLFARQRHRRRPGRLPPALPLRQGDQERARPPHRRRPSPASATRPPGLDHRRRPRRLAGPLPAGRPQRRARAGS